MHLDAVTNKHFRRAMYEVMACGQAGSQGPASKSATSTKSKRVRKGVAKGMAKAVQIAPKQAAPAEFKEVSLG